MDNLEVSNYQGRKTRIRTELNKVADSFIVIGYELKQIRDNEEYKQDGYATIADFALAEYNLSQSATSKFISINERYSVNGNSPELLEEYKGYGHTKLSDMLSLKGDEEQLVTIHTTRAEIKEIKDIRKEAINAEYSSGNISESIDNTQSEDDFSGKEKCIIPDAEKWLIKFFRERKRRDILKQLVAAFMEYGIVSESIASEIINPSQYLLFQDGLTSISFQETVIKYKKAFGAVIDFTYNDILHDIRLTFDMSVSDPALDFYGEPEPDPISQKEVIPPKVETKQSLTQKTTSKPEVKTTAKPIITQSEDDNEDDEDIEESKEKIEDDIPGQAVIEDYPELLPEVTETVIEEQKITDIVAEHQEITTNEQVIEKTSLDELELSVMTYNVLKRSGVNTILNLCEMTEYEVSNIRNMGRRALDEINSKLKSYGLSLKQEEIVEVLEADIVENISQQKKGEYEELIQWHRMDEKPSVKEDITELLIAIIHKDEPKVIIGKYLNRFNIFGADDKEMCDSQEYKYWAYMPETPLSKCKC